jgi:hypothetical protein
MTLRNYVETYLATYTYVCTLVFQIDLMHCHENQLARYVWCRLRCSKSIYISRHLTLIHKC